MIPFIDLKAQFHAHEESIRTRIESVLSHGQFILGPEVEELEYRLAEYTGAKHCIGCASGTDALLLTLMAESIGSGDAVITTSFTFIATAEVIALRGARPIFLDINPQTWNISPAALQHCLKHWNPAWGRPRAIIAVDMFGLPAPYPELSQIAQEYELLLIEDAAQGFGADIATQKACSFGDYAATSFFPAKPLGCYGDGGAVFCQDADKAAIVRSLRFHGKGEDKYDNVLVGLNSRLDTLQAAVLLAKLETFDLELQTRQRLAQIYTETLDGLGERLILPHIPSTYQSAWAQFSFLLQSSTERARIQQVMKNAGIPTMIYYPKPLHLKKAFSNLGYESGDLPVCEDVSQRILSLPMHPYLKEAEACEMAQKLKKALN